jgi:DNA repair protein RadD
MFVLRPHQERDYGLLRQSVARHRATLLVAPCGYGKGVLTTKIIDGSRRKGKHVIFLVHGKDRVNDMDERVTKLGIPHGILLGGKRRDKEHSVQIASSDTVYRMDEKPKADLVVIDEAHLAMSPTFREVLDFYPDAKIIGMTATPVLGTGRALGRKSGGIYDSMIVGPSVQELINERYLVRSRVMAPPEPEGLKALKKKRTGEFDEAQGADICDRRKIIGDIIAHWKRYSSDRKTAVFAFTQGHAFHIAEQFREQGINWAYVDADTPDGDIHTPGTRKFIWHQFDHGDLVGVSSVGCISVGWDHSICKSLILASRTASFPLYHQRLGRGSRPHPGYDDFLVSDHTGNLYVHEDDGPYFESDIQWQLDGDPVVTRDDGPGISTCKVPMLIPASGVPSWFRGDHNGEWMFCCFSTFARGPKECPFCGLPVAGEGAEMGVTVEPGELMEVKKGDHIARVDTPAQQKKKDRLIELTMEANERNYKPGWPAVVFKSEFHHWPPGAWKREAWDLAEKLIGPWANRP